VISLASFRDQFPITQSRAYLFNGAATPAAVSVRAEADRWATAWSTNPLANYGLYEEELTLLRNSFAQLIGAKPEGIAVLDSTSTGSNLAIGLLASRPKGNVVVDETTYPSSLYPLSTLTEHDVRFISTSRCDDPSARLAAAVDASTVAISISHVAPFTGRRHDLVMLAEAVHAVGGLLIVDAAQTAGVTPIDVASDGIDVLTTTAMKWLLGTPGIAFLFVRPELADESPVQRVGHSSLVMPWQDWPVLDRPPLHPGARRFEVGLPSLPGLSATRAGIDLIRDVGVASIAAHVEGLTTYCLDELAERGLATTTPREPRLHGGVMVFEHARPLELRSFLGAHGVDVGAYSWGPVRVDPHGFNTERDIDRFLTGLDSFAEGESPPRVGRDTHPTAPSNP
jgi:selenocysteine lyase/cysteine desulfurase